MRTIDDDENYQVKNMEMRVIMICEQTVSINYNEYLLPHTLHSLYFKIPRHPWGQHSKFYVSYSTYPYMAYPDYCLGWIVAATVPTIETLLQEV